jgi:hypothetical protein
MPRPILHKLNQISVRHDGILGRHFVQQTANNLHDSRFRFSLQPPMLYVSPGRPFSSTARQHSDLPRSADPLGSARLHKRVETFLCGHSESLAGSVSLETGMARNCSSSSWSAPEIHRYENKRAPDDPRPPWFPSTDCWAGTTILLGMRDPLDPRIRRPHP